MHLSRGGAGARLRLYSGLGCKVEGLGSFREFRGCDFGVQGLPLNPGRGAKGILICIEMGCFVGVPESPSAS